MLILNKALDYSKRRIKNSKGGRIDLNILLKYRAYIEEDLGINRANISIYYRDYSSAGG